MTFKFEVILYYDSMPRIVYKRYGEIHKNNNPACVYISGSNYWYQYGFIHRDDGPASIDSFGNKQWFNHGIYYVPKI
jgi:hypothetical protein